MISFEMRSSNNRSKTKYQITNMIDNFQRQMSSIFVMKKIVQEKVPLFCELPHRNIAPNARASSPQEEKAQETHKHSQLNLQSQSTSKNKIK